jgi:predicted transcriptional regulator
MARRRSPALTDGELRIMRVLWEQDRETDGDVVEAKNVTPNAAY